MVYGVSSRPDMVHDVVGDRAAVQAQRPEPSRRPVGRPRKWASEAERKRAYRERLAADVDEPLTLRRELRTERRRAAGLQQANRRLRAELIALRARTEEAEQVAEDLRARTDWLATKAEADRRQTLDSLAKVRELQAEVERLQATGHVSGLLPTPVAPQTLRELGGPHATSRPVPSPLVRPCDWVGCPLPAVSRLQGPRGVERDACESHERPDRKARRWRVIRRY